MSAYNLPAALCLRGEVNAAVLKRSLDAIWARHEGLRSVFVVEEGEPRVELLPVEMGLPLLEHDVRGARDAEAQLKELMRTEAQAPFDLKRGPLIRARLVRMQEEEHVLLLTQHHIVSDGWSMGILARELGALYGAFSRGEENPLEPLGIQYPDYAAWQREWLKGRAAAEAERVLAGGAGGMRRCCWSCRRIVRGRSSRALLAVFVPCCDRAGTDRGG